MFGHGTNIQSNFGWAIDSATGEAEVWYWQGTVYKHTHNGTSWSIAKEQIRSNKLYKLTFDHNNREVGRTLIWDGKDAYPGDQAEDSQQFGNLIFISRDVFLITEVFQVGGGSDTPRHVRVHANKITGNDTDGWSVEDRIWTRELRKEGTSSSSTSSNSYPGTVLGMSYAPLQSSEYDTWRDFSNIIVATAPSMSGGPWDSDGDSGQNHHLGIYRLDTIEANMGNTGLGQDDAYADVDTEYPWISIKTFGDNWDAVEGWMTTDSEGNMYYGNAIGYNDHNGAQSGYGTSNPMLGANGVGSITPAGPAYVPTIDGNFNMINSSPPQFDENLMFHDTMFISSPLESSSSPTLQNSGNHVWLRYDSNHFDGLNTVYDGEPKNGLSSFDLWGAYGPAAPPGGDPVPGPGVYWPTYANTMMADGGCCDLFGESSWGKEHGKDVILAIVPRNSRLITFGSDSWSPKMTYNREGIYAFKKDGNKLVILDTDGMNPNGQASSFLYKDVNSQPRLSYAFDGTWADNSDHGWIPVIDDPNDSNNEQTFWRAHNNGMSFRPKSLMRS